MQVLHIILRTIYDDFEMDLYSIPSFYGDLEELNGGMYSTSFLTSG